MKTAQDHDKAVVIAGAGLTGLMCALKLKKSAPERDVVVFDRAPEVGGMYGSFHYPGGIVFDHGMHVVYESCNSDVDDLYREVMPESEWNIYVDNEKDIAGLFFRGRLQTYSHYADLRTYPREVCDVFIGSMLNTLAEQTPNPDNKAVVFLENQFGRPIVEAVHIPLLTKLYGVSPDALDVFAVKATALERVILLGESVVEGLMQSPLIRSRIAYPDQLGLPVRRENTQKALYPKRFGMATFIDRLKAHLQSLGVDIMTATDLTGLTLEDGRIQEVVLQPKAGSPVSKSVGHLLWTTGWTSLAQALGIGISDLSFEKGPDMLFVNLLFDKPVQMDRLYYFYCYDEGFASFRVTNYANYCPDAAAGGRYPVCVELWPSRRGLKRGDLDPETARDIAIEELKKFGVIDSTHNLMFFASESNVGSFPLPTTKNKLGLHEIRKRVDSLAIGNLSTAGVMADDGLFFLPDVLNHAFSQLDRLS